jgi:hypothetical protein
LSHHPNVDCFREVRHPIAEIGFMEVSPSRSESREVFGALLLGLLLFTTSSVSFVLSYRIPFKTLVNLSCVALLPQPLSLLSFQPMSLVTK